LAESLSSLAFQTFRDFEVILVDDGYTDATQQVAESFAVSLTLRVLANSVDSGVAASLNRGIAGGESLFIARLDADDIAHPERFAQQLALIDANPNVEVCSSDMPMFQTVAAGSSAVRRQPATDAGIKAMMLQYNALSHPTVIVRRSFFDTVGLYDPAFDFAEDYELWRRGALMGRYRAHLQSPLTCYRVHPGHVSQAKM